MNFLCAWAMQRPGRLGWSRKQGPEALPALGVVFRALVGANATQNHSYPFWSGRVWWGGGGPGPGWWWGRGSSLPSLRDFGHSRKMAPAGSASLLEMNATPATRCLEEKSLINCPPPSSCKETGSRSLGFYFKPLQQGTSRDLTSLVSPLHGTSQRQALPLPASLGCPRTPDVSPPSRSWHVWLRAGPLQTSCPVPTLAGPPWACHVTRLICKVGMLTKHLPP